MASSDNTAIGHCHAIIGYSKNLWGYDSIHGFDLTHRPDPSSPMVTPSVTMRTSATSITVDPVKTSLIIVDMQNYFLSPLLGRTRSGGHAALDQLVRYAIPAAREAGIGIIWLNWGLNGQELNDMPPGLLRMFGFEAQSDGKKMPANRHGGLGPGHHTGLGSQLGVRFDDASGKKIDAGRVLMRDEWNSNLYYPLDKAFDEGKALRSRPDVWIHKNRLSGMWDQQSACEQFLRQERITTLMFAGVNTDQCVGGTLQDAFSKGYDCIMLSDGCGTSSPGFAQQCMEFNTTNCWGFVTSCQAFAEAVGNMRERIGG